MEKFNALYSVLNVLQQKGILGECILIGSWCQGFYRERFNSPFQIPATTTTDADLFIPKKMKNFEPCIDMSEALEQSGFVSVIDRLSNFEKFMNEYFEVEFHTEASAKSEEGIIKFKNLNLVAGELRFMEIPLKYNFKYKFRDLEIRLPEPEAYALHKLIISQRRKDEAKKEKDIEAVKGMFEYFENKENHIKRLHQILDSFPKGWIKKVNKALKITEISLPTII